MRLAQDMSSSGVWGGIKTEYFYGITPEKILDAVESFGFRCTGRVMSMHSLENRVYEAEVEPSGFKVIKFYRPGRWSREQILEEHSFLRELAAEDIPAVEAIVDSNGESLHEVDGIYFAVFPKVGGRSPDDLNDEALIRLGRLLGRLHNIGARKNFKARLSISPLVYGLQNMRFLVDEKIIIPELSSLFENLVKRICDFSEPLFKDVTYQRVHGDAHKGNILIRDEIFSLIDFDDTVMAPAVQDFWLMVQGRDKEACDALSLLLMGYEEMRHFNRNELSLIEPLRALRMIHYAAWIAHRRDDPAFKNVFTHFGTQQYWMELVADLQEQLEVMQNKQFWRC